MFFSIEFRFLDQFLVLKVNQFLQYLTIFAIVSVTKKETVKLDAR